MGFVRAAAFRTFFWDYAAVSGLYQVMKPTEGVPLASITNMGADNKTVRLFIYQEMRSPDDPNLMKHTAYYRRSGIMDALYGLKPLGTCYSFFTLESNYVVIWIADYQSNGTAASLENELRRIASIVNGG